MNSKILTGLAIAAALLIGQPAFAHSGRGKGGAAVRGGPPRVAAAHVAVNHAPVRNFAAAHVAVNRAPVRNFAAARVHNNVRSGAFAARGRVSAPVARNFTVNRSNVRNNFVRSNNSSRNTVAFSGGSSRYNNNSNNRGRFAFASHDGWSRDREYNWRGHHYRWYDNGWFIIDPFPYAYGDYGPDYGYSYGAGAPVSVEVQQALQQQGYYQGPVDGIVGPGTSAAIAAYQQDNGLRVTGTINRSLLYNLGIG